jgi:hypothetical protein
VDADQGRTVRSARRRLMPLTPRGSSIEMRYRSGSHHA